MPLSKLNTEQYKAATAPFGHNLIIASAGTGKTSTITARINHLMNSGIKPKEILLLTFTNKAASEMISRVASFCGDKTAKEIEAGTFHAVAYRLLKSFGYKIVLKQPKQMKILLKSIVEKRVYHHIDCKEKPYSASFLYDSFSLYQNSSDGEKYTQWLEDIRPEHEPFFDIYEDIYEEFQKEKKEFGYVDFNDLLMFLIEEMKNQSLNFKEILVDEYQDTNTLQGRVIDAFTPESLFCVGDYDQSIYAFNGANINIIGSFKERYKDSKIYSLNKNYRSSLPILSLANKVIEKNARLYPKKLEVTRTNSHESPALYVFGELFEQYAQIALMIKNSKTTHQEIAVLFRNNSSADGIEAHLREIGIACKRRGGVNFFDALEVRAALDIFSFLLNPRDLMSFIHIFEYAKGVGSVFAKEVYEALKVLGAGDVEKGLLHPDITVVNPYKPMVKSYQLGLFENDNEIGSTARFRNLDFDEKFLENPILKTNKMTKDGAVFLYGFYQFVKEAKKLKKPNIIVANIANSKPFEMISELLATKRATRKDGSLDSDIKSDSLVKIKTKMALLEQIARNYQDKERFFNAMTLGGSEMSEGEGVNLLSVHASKGLEFDEVYIVDLMDGRFPNHKLSKGAGELEEERRLFYVSVTRARDRLYLSYAKFDKIKKIEYVHSQFLSEAGLIR